MSALLGKYDFETDEQANNHPWGQQLVVDLLEVKHFEGLESFAQSIASDPISLFKDKDKTSISLTLTLIEYERTTSSISHMRIPVLAQHSRHRLMPPQSNTCVCYVLPIISFAVTVNMSVSLVTMSLNHLPR